MILGPVHVTVAAEPCPDVAVGEPGRVRQRALDEAGVADRRRRRQRVQPRLVAAVAGADAFGAAPRVDEAHARADESEIGVPIEVRELRGEALGSGDVVVVHAGDERPARGGQATRQRADETRGVTADAAQARVGGQTRDEGVDVVVTDDDELEIGLRLREHAPHGPGGAVAPRAYRHDDRDERARRSAVR